MLENALRPGRSPELHTEWSARARRPRPSRKVRASDQPYVVSRPRLSSRRQAQFFYSTWYRFNESSCVGIFRILEYL
jgi:hypothetical protein